MNRHVVAAGIVGLVLALTLTLILGGCSLDRSGEQRANPKLPLAGLMSPLPSSQEAIAKDNAQAPPATARNAEREWPPTAVTDAGSPAPQGKAAGTSGPSGEAVAAEVPAPTPAAAPDEGAPGRPALTARGGGVGARPRATATPTVNQGTSQARSDPAPTGSAPDWATPAAGAALPGPAEASSNLAAVPIPRRVPAAELPAQESTVARTSAETRAGATPSPAPAAATEPPALSTAERPTASAPAEATGPTNPQNGLPRTRTLTRDPLLGPNPDIMPPMDDLIAGARPRDAAVAPAPPPVGQGSAPVSRAEPPAVGLAPGAAAGARSLPSRPATEPASPAAVVAGVPRSRRDPLLGPNPDIMPPIEMLAPAGAAPHASTPPAPAPAPLPAPASAPAVPAAPAPAPAPLPAPASAPAPTPTPTPPAAPTAATPRTDDKTRPAGMSPDNGSDPASAPPVELPPLSVPGVSLDRSATDTDVAVVRAPRPRIIRVSYQPPAREGQVSSPITAAIPTPVQAPATVAEPPPPGTLVLPDAYMPPPPRDPAVTQAAAQPATPAPAALPPLVRSPIPPLPGHPDARPPAGDPMAVRAGPEPRSVFQEGKAAARVGDEIITLHELKKAIVLRRRGLNTGPLSRADNYRLAKTVLDEIVDRAIVTQEAKREIKDKKQLDMFMKQADKLWTDEELPPLLRQTASTNIFELKQKLTEREESLDEMQEAFRKEFLFRGFLEFKIGPKLRVDLPEMVDYYNAHLKDFDQPATVTWREVVVEVSKHPDRLAARRKADALLARLRHGEDFAALARAQSDGPNKTEGGAWQTSPGGYAVPAVNAALGTLSVGQLSPVLEGPTSYHVVRVEARRDAGPASFAEVQDRIKKAVRAEKVARESNAYLEKLRKNTVVSTVFDNPAVQRTSGVMPAPRTPASGR